MLNNTVMKQNDIIIQETFSSFTTSAKKTDFLLTLRSWNFSVRTVLPVLFLILWWCAFTSMSVLYLRQEWNTGIHVTLVGVLAGIPFFSAWIGVLGVIIIKLFSIETCVLNDSGYTYQWNALCFHSQHFIPLEDIRSFLIIKSTFHPQTRTRDYCIRLHYTDGSLDFLNRAGKQALHRWFFINAGSLLIKLKKNTGLSSKKISHKGHDKCSLERWHVLTDSDGTITLARVGDFRFTEFFGSLFACLFIIPVGLIMLLGALGQLEENSSDSSCFMYTAVTLIIFLPASLISFFYWINELKRGCSVNCWVFTPGFIRHSWSLFYLKFIRNYNIQNVYGAVLKPNINRFGIMLSMRLELQDSEGNTLFTFHHLEKKEGRWLSSYLDQNGIILNKKDENDEYS